MKWRLMTVLAALCFLIPAFTSCDKDDKVEPPAVDTIAGSYVGYLEYSVMGYPAGNLDGTYSLQIVEDAADKDGVTVILPECSFTYPGSTAGAYTIPALKVTGVEVSAKGNIYTLTDDDFSIEIDGAPYTGKLTGTVAGKEAKVAYTVRPGRMPMDINFTFQGTVK